MKKLIALFLSLVLITGTMVGCGDSKPTPASTPEKSSSEATTPAVEEGKVLNVHCWNDEFQRRLTEFYPDYNNDTKKIGDVSVNWIITPNENNAYQNALDEALLAQSSGAADSKVDLFLIEADYALKYTDAKANVAMDVKSVGLTDADMSQQLQYTKDIVTDATGVQRGVTWQGCPGVFIYRRSIAKKVLGTDDPAAVQAAVANWDKFDATAADISKKGYKMLAGFDDSYRAFSNNVSAPWVNDKMEVAIDANMMKWVDQTKTFTEKGYNNPVNLWDGDVWAKNMGSAGKAFGYFGPAWFIDFVMAGNSMDKAEADGGKAEIGNGAYGDYAACAGPQSYFWGGTWMCAANGSDNVSLIANIMKAMTCSEETATNLTKKCNEFANNIKAMETIAKSDFSSKFLGGQNVIGAMCESAKKIDMSKISPYDQGLNEEFQNAFHDYFNGTVTKEKALQNFYSAAKVKYPELKMPS